MKSGLYTYEVQVIHADIFVIGYFFFQVATASLVLDMNCLLRQGLDMA